MKIHIGDTFTIYYSNKNYKNITKQENQTTNTQFGILDHNKITKYNTIYYFESKNKKLIENQNKNKFVYILYPLPNKPVTAFINDFNISFILMNLNLNKNTILLEGGHGSGYFCREASLIAKKVFSVEKNHVEEKIDNVEILMGDLKNIRIGNENIDNKNIRIDNYIDNKDIENKNIRIDNENIKIDNNENIDNDNKNIRIYNNKNIDKFLFIKDIPDCIFLDIPNPHDILPNLQHFFKKEFSLGIYVISVQQIFKVLDFMKNNFKKIEIFENVGREYSGKRIEIKSIEMHGAYLIFGWN